MTDARRGIGLCPRFFVALVSLSWSLGAAAQSADDWLERMVRADELFNYQGTLVHMCGDAMDIVQIVHRVDDGRVTERITARTSGGRQIIRNADEVMCILPDQNKVMVEHGAASSPLAARIANFSSFSGLDSALYQTVLLGSDRVAEQETVVLAIRPIDEHRFGYRLWLDRRTALPLKFELVDAAGQGLEQGMFTEIRFSESIPAQAVEPTIATEAFEWQHSAVVAGVATAAAQSPASPNWRVGSLPPGFELAHAESTQTDGAAGPMEQLVFSDGLATISVFIEADVADAPGIEGESHIGATHAMSTIIDGYLVTAMGGVPAGTVRMVALSVAQR